MLIIAAFRGRLRGSLRQVMHSEICSDFRSGDGKCALDFELSLYIIAAVLGILGGCSANRFPASGKAALVLGLVPAAGLGLSMAFC